MAKIIALLIGKANSKGMPGKNWVNINGMPSCEYGFISGKYDKRISGHFVSTDSEEIASIGETYNYQLIKRPAYLATSEALTEDALVHAHKEICSQLKYEIMVLLFANNPAINRNLLSQAITMLDENPAADSVFSVCKYNMFSPTRARKVSKGEIKPFIPLENFGEINSIRNSQGDVYFCDLSIQVIRSRVFDHIEEGQLPFKWQGKKSLAIYNNYGFDIDEEWQKISIENWIKKYW